jgi:hypothetical protein
MNQGTGPIYRAHGTGPIYRAHVYRAHRGNKEEYMRVQSLVFSEYRKQVLHIAFSVCEV